MALQKNKLILGLFLFVSLALMTPLAIASTPSYNMSTLLDNEVDNGENDIGSLILLSDGYIPTTHHVPVLMNITVQQHDRFVWENNRSIRITPPVGNEVLLVSGGEYVFPYSGNYVFSMVSDSTNNSVIGADPADPSIITLSTVKTPIGVNLSFSKSKFELIKEQTIGLSLDIDDDVPPGDYKIRYGVDMNGKQSNFTHEISLQSRKTWEVTQNNLSNMTVPTGSVQEIGRMVLESTANAQTEISVTKHGNASNMISIPRAQTLFPKSSLTLVLQLQVPTGQKAGTYHSQIVVQGGENKTTIPLRVRIKDSIAPFIEEINFSTGYVYTQNLLKVVATDNNDVERVVLNYTGKSHNFTKDGNIFSKKVTFDKLSEYQLIFCAYDKENNHACKEMNKTFTKQDVVQVLDTTVKLPTVKTGKYAKMHIINISEDIEEGVKIQLLDLRNTKGEVGTGNATSEPIIRIVESDDTKKSFSEYDNMITTTKTGKFFLEMRSDVVDEYEGTLRIILPDYAQEVDDISFVSKFAEYDIPQDFTKLWFDGQEIDCRVHDSGDLETSYYRCDMNFPVSIKPEDISFPTTIREKTQLDTMVNEVEEDLTDYKRRSSVFITLLTVLLVVGGLVAYYLFVIYPFTRLRPVVKEEK